jgi:hypothetical protein
LERTDSVHSECHSELIRFVQNAIPNAPSRCSTDQESAASDAAAACCIESLEEIGAPAQKGNSSLKALFLNSIKCDSCTAVAFSALKLRAAAMDVPVVHYGMATLPRATERDVARPEQASQPLAR